MKKRIALIICSFAILFTIITCKGVDKPITYIDDYHLTVFPVKHTFPASGDSLSLNIEATKTTSVMSNGIVGDTKTFNMPYSISVTGSGFSVNENMIIVEKNNDCNDRTGTVIIRIDGTNKEQIIELIQLGFGYPVSFFSYSSYGNGEFKVYTNVKDSLYSMFKIVHQKSEQHNRDLWRIMDSYFTIYKNGKMIQSTNILTAGENEFVWISNRLGVSEFTGGFHGNERIDQENCFARFYADSKEINTEISHDLTPCSSFYYHQKSLMYETGTGGTITSPNYKPIENAPVECIHEKKTTFTDGGYETYNKVIWNNNSTPVKRMFYGIFCVTGDVSKHGYNDSGTSDPEIIQFVDDGMRKLNYSSQRIVMFNKKDGIGVVCDSEVLKGCPFMLNTYVWDHAIYHKYYSSLNSNGAFIQTASGEIWETSASISFYLIEQ